MATIWPAGVWLFSKVGFCRVALFPHGTARMFSDRRRLSGKIFRDKRFLGCFRVELRVHRELGTACGDLRSQRVAQNDSATDINCISLMLRLFEIEIQSAQVPELRLWQHPISCSTISGHMNHICSRKCCS
jgi:hypothetical protein